MGIKLIDKINAEQTANLAEKNFPEFHTGDIVRVSIKIKEGEKFRVQDFEGKVLAIDNGRKNVSGTFTVSRESYGVRVEKLFPFASPWIQAIKVVKKGNVRKGDKPKGRGVRAKLYTERTFCSHKAVRKLVKK
jgi:large subunit ribosomal protein L19